MPKKIIWSQSSLLDRLEIYSYWLENNKSDNYSEKLEKAFKDLVERLLIFPKSGARTSDPEVRFKIYKDYKLFYRIEGESIEVLRVLNTYRNPTNF